MTGRVPGRRSPGALAAVVALVVTSLLATALAACGGQPAAAPSPDQTAAFDQALHDRLPDDVRDAGVVTIATDASYPPASSYAPDGQTIVGFEPDLLAALGEVLGVRMELRVTSFDAVLEDVEAHRVDAAMSAVTDTVEREQRADFVNYFSAGTSILVQRGNPHAIADLADLCGQVVAVETGTVQLDLLERSQARCADKPIDVRTHASNADALVELRTGRAAAVLNDYPPAVYLATGARTQADYQLASDTQYEPGLYGIAVARDRTLLRDALQAALERLVATGVYQDVLTRWGVADGAVATVSVNAGRRLAG